MECHITQMSEKSINNSWKTATKQLHQILKGVKMLNRIFENNRVNGIRRSCEDPSPDRCSQAQQGVPSCHPAIATVKWNNEASKVVIKYFTEVSHLIKKENLLGDTERECLEMKDKKNI